MYDSALYKYTTDTYSDIDTSMHSIQPMPQMSRCHQHFNVNVGIHSSTSRPSGIRNWCNWDTDI